MDLFAHLAWSYIFFGKFVGLEQLAQILFFSVFPDLIWGTPALFVFVWLKIKTGKGRFLIHEREGWIRTLYYSSHSFVSVLVLFLFSSVLTKSIYLSLIYGWGLHLLFDMFLHKGTLGNKPLFPLKYRINGLTHWTEKKALLINWIIICLLLIVLFLGLL